ncbi:hypothetical protein ACHWUR_00240, partial [Klebsiella pneumoniae]
KVREDKGFNASAPLNFAEKSVFAYFLRGVIMAGRNKQPLSVIRGKGRSNHITKVRKTDEKNKKKHCGGILIKLKLLLI